MVVLASRGVVLVKSVVGVVVIIGIVAFAVEAVF